MTPTPGDKFGSAALVLSLLVFGVFFANVVIGGPIRDGSSEDALRTMETVYRIYQADPEWAARWGL